MPNASGGGGSVWQGAWNFGYHPEVPKAAATFDLRNALLGAFATNHRITCYLIENVPELAWSMKPPEGKGRTIAAIAVHIHNVRVMWLKATGSTPLPGKLEESASQGGVLQALEESYRALAMLLGPALEVGQVKSFKPDAASFFAYLVTHEAHHRGQIMSLARRLGHPVSQSAGFGLWEWGTRSKEVGPAGADS